MSDKNPIKLRFADDFKSPTLEIGHGSEYVRKFDIKDAPFEMVGLTHTEPGSDNKDRVVVDMTPEEEAKILLATGHFVAVEEAKPKASTSSLKSEGKIAGSSTPNE